jgi:hypothetical protein
LADKRSLQALMVLWVDRRQEKKATMRIPEAILNRVYEVNDALYGEGTAYVIEQCLKQGGATEASRFLGSFRKLFMGSKDEKASYRGKPALELAIQLDAPRFLATSELLRQNNSDDIRIELSKNLDIFFTKHLFKPVGNVSDQPDSPLLEWRPQQTDKVVTDSFERAFKSLSPPGKGTLTVTPLQVEMQLKAFGHYLRTYPENAEVRYQRARSLFTYRRQYQEAETDLNRALRIEARPKYYELLGDLRFERDGPPASFDPYHAALDRATTKQDDVDHRAGPLHAKLALAYILQSDPKHAEQHLAQANALLKTDLEKACAREKRGLLLLQQGGAKAWQDALDNARTVEKLSSSTYLNKAVRYLASRELGDQAKAEEDLKAWEMPHELTEVWDKPPRATSVVLLWAAVPNLVKKHFGDFRPLEAVLRQQPQKRDIIDTHELLLEKGQTYAIYMESQVLDSYLILYNPQGKEIRRDDDSGGNLNARIEYTPQATGSYRLEATSLGRLSQGPYTLIVRQLPKRGD